MTTDQSPESELRAEFDRWDWGGADPVTLDWMWLAYQAGHRRAQEQAAKVCDTIAGNTKDFDQWTRRAAGMCAANIRALTEGKHT